MREEREGRRRGRHLKQPELHEATRCTYVPSSRHPTIFAVPPTNEGGVPGARDGGGRDRAFRRCLLLSWKLVTQKQIYQCCYSLHSLKKDLWKVCQAAGNGLQLVFFKVSCCFLESRRVGDDIRVGDFNRVA